MDLPASLAGLFRRKISKEEEESSLVCLSSWINPTDPEDEKTQTRVDSKRSSSGTVEVFRSQVSSGTIPQSGPELFFGLSRKGFDWRICDPYGDREMDLAVFSYPILTPSKAKEMAAAAQSTLVSASSTRRSTVRIVGSWIQDLFQGGESSSMAVGSGSRFEVESLGESTPVHSTELSHSRSKSGEEKIPKAHNVSMASVMADNSHPQASVLQIYLKVVKGSEPTRKSLFKCSLMFWDHNENMVDELALSEVESVNADESSAETNSVLITTLARNIRAAFPTVSVLDSFLDTIHQIQDFADTLKTDYFHQIDIPESILSQMVFIHSGSLSAESIPASPKYAALATGKLVFFKNKTSSKPVFVLPLGNMFRIDIKDSVSFVLHQAEFPSLEVKTRSEVLRNQWICALDFETYLRDLPSPVQNIKVSKRRSFAMGDDDASEEEIRKQLMELKTLVTVEQDLTTETSATAPCFDVPIGYDITDFTVTLELESKSLQGYLIFSPES
jgi:hypothetical protein